VTEMGHLDPIAYTYEADYHCEACTAEPFGRGSCGWVACTRQDDLHASALGGTEHALDIFAEDSEGNEVHALFQWDEWWETSEPGTQVLVCSDCGVEIDRLDGDPIDGPECRWCEEPIVAYVHSEMGPLKASAWTTIGPDDYRDQRNGTYCWCSPSWLHEPDEESEE